MASKKTAVNTEAEVAELEAEAAVEEVKPTELPDERDEIIKELRRELAEARKAQKWDAPVGKPEPETTPEVILTKAADPWEEYIQVTPPRHGRGQEKSFYVSVNGRNAQIPADGRPIMLRKPLALAFLQSLEAEARAEDFAENLPHEAAPASFADLMNVINDLKRKLAENGIKV